MATNQWLVERHGAEHVAHEQPTGAGGARIDLAVRLAPDQLVFYEIKTYPSLMAGIRVALGQLLEYAYFPEGCRADQLVIVSYHKPEPAAMQYLENLRVRTGLPVYYGYFDLEEATLVM